MPVALGVTNFVSDLEIKRVENYQHGLQGLKVKNIEAESKEANIAIFCRSGSAAT